METETTDEEKAEVPATEEATEEDAA